MDRHLSDDLIIAGNQRVVEREYWLKKLSGDFQRGSIPYDVSGDAATQELRSIEHFTLPHSLACSCLRLANHSNYNLYLILCAGLVALISRHTRNLDIVIGSPVLQDDGTGELLNTVIPLRVQLSETMSFKQLLTQLKAVHLEGTKHQNYPIEMLAAHFGHDGHGSSFPLFEIVALLDEIHLKRFFHKTGPSITFTFGHTNINDDAMTTQITYNPALYEKQTIEHLFQQFTHLLTQALAHLDNLPLLDLEIATSEELYDLVHGSNRTPATFPEQATITQLFEETVAQFPHKVALQFGDTQVTYATLNNQANQLASVLRAKGTQPDTLIGIYTERSLEMVVGALAVLKAGAAYLPLDPGLPLERIKYMLEDSRAQIVLTQSSLAESLHLYDLVFFDHHKSLAGLETNLLPLHNSSSLAYVIYTSGTTGNPKGVMVEHRQVVRLLRNDAFQFDFNANDTWTLFHSFCFDFSVWEMYGALFNGSRLIIIPQSMTLDLSSYLALLKQEQVTVLNQTPGAFSRLLTEECRLETHTLTLRYIIFGGEALHPNRLQQWHHLYPQTRLINMYGITETTVHVTSKEITAAEIQMPISNIGRPIPTTSVYILDSKLQPVPRGMIGEIFVGGEGVARGYLHNPTLTQQKFIPDPFSPGERVYRTGDLGRWRNNRDIEYIGRADQQVKIHGFRIEIGEIEAQILKFPALTNAVVLPVEDAQSDLALCAYIVVKPHLTPSIVIFELKQYLQQVLPAYMFPAFIVPVSDLPLTSQGKLNKTALPDPKQFVDTGTHYLPPRNLLERQLVEIWAHVLQLPEEKIGIHDRFFDLGGNSFSVLELNNKVQAALHRTISVMSHFQYPTILSFVASLESSDGTQERAIQAEIEEATDGEETYSMMEELSRLAGGMQDE